MNSIGYSLKQAVRQIWRNKVMSIASMFSITAMLLILGLFFMLTVNVNMVTENIKDQFDTVEVFLLDETDLTEAYTIRKSILAMDEVAGVEYISKEDALQDFKLRYGENSYLFDGLVENPLPNSLRVKLSDLADGEVVAEFCRNMEGVEDVRFYQTEVNKILKVTTALQRAALVIVIFLIIVSVVVVSNTIKITVEARKSEIMIMKYVGATNWFIRGPMLFEGMLIGLVSALIAFGITSGVYARIVKQFSDQMMVLLSTSFVDSVYMTKTLVWIFVALGVAIGAVGSIISMRRYLKE
ncbi:MAG: permease-like cell division protein FtsX [Firmicutes bacterium]|nr:permease-like cell division protein FtsX [Bacillota bacterium]